MLDILVTEICLQRPRIVAPVGQRIAAGMPEHVMAGSVNWSRVASRKRMRRQGIEDRKDKTPVVEPAKQPRRKLSKAELREQAAAAFLAWRADQTAKNK